MSITTEEAERHARLLGVFPAPAAALRSLAAERDTLKAENEKLRAALAECNVWVTAAIECKDWMWDGAQKEAAIFARDQARAALGEKE